MKMKLIYANNINDEYEMKQYFLIRMILGKMKDILWYEDIYCISFNIRMKSNM